MTPKHFVIIGSGPCGIFAVEAIRARDRESSITLVTGDRGFATSPVMLTYWMGGAVPQEALFFRDPAWATKMRTEVRLNTRVISLNPTSRELTLEGGEVLSYDCVLIATGATPISLPLPGITSQGVATLRTVQDAETIIVEHRGGPDVREVVILGGGFIGLKLACHLRERKIGVAVLEKEPKLAARTFDLKASRLVQRKLAESGIRVETDVEVTEVLNENEWVTGVRLKGGRDVPCQRVVQAVGVRPNVAFLPGSGIEVRGGVLVNDRMETNRPGVYAAGDVTVMTDSITSELLNNATWSAATHQGRVAGSNMAGGDQKYIHNFSFNSADLSGFRVMAAGHPYYETQPGIHVSVHEQGESYRKIVLRGGRLIGFILVGDVAGAGFLLSLMKRGVEFTTDRWDDFLSSRTFQHDLPPHLGFTHGVLFAGTERKDIDPPI